VATEFPPGPGGIATHAWEIARHAAAAGWDVTVLAPQEYSGVGRVEAFDTAQPFAVVRMATTGLLPWRTVKRIRKASRLADIVDADVVLGSGDWAVWLTALAPGTRRRPRVAVGHGLEFGRPSRVVRFIHRRTYGRVTAVVCVSRYTQRRMQEAGITPPRVEVIPNGGDDSQFRPGEDARQQLLDPLLHDKKLLLTVGNIGERKAQDIVVRALPDIVATGIDVHYVVVGLDDRAPALLALAEELGVRDRVHVLGPLLPAQLLLAYQACDVFVMTSRNASNGDFEGYGIAVLEAALCGKPAIVTDNCGLAEAVADGESGLVVPQEDPSAFGRAAAGLLADDKRRRTLGDAARARVLRSGTWEVRASEYLALLDDACHARR
jgi:phosphatidylinositol alpha-1,6-mannosyltransferase